LQIERHIFGNQRGYTTLARSAGVDAEVCRQLESAAFGFGQTNDPRFAQSLATQVVFFVRELPGNRRCLTRVLQGQPDDNGRPTLMLISAILNRDDWDRRLMGNVQFLLGREELWQWDGSTTLAAIRLPACPPPRTMPPALVVKLLSLISEIERQPQQQTTVSINEYGVGALAALEVLIPPTSRPAVSIGCGSLNGQFPVTVNAPSTAAPARAPTFRSGGLLGDLSPYAKFLADAGLLTGVVPLEKIMTYRGFGNESPPPLTTEVRSNRGLPGRGGFVPSLVAVAVLSVVLSFVSYIVAHTQAQDAIHDLQAKLAQLQNESNAQHAQFKTEIDGLKDAIGQANARTGRVGQETTKSLAEARTQIQKAFNDQMGTLGKRIGTVEQDNERLKSLLPKPPTTQSTQPARGGKI
jgi:hypothetical protein